MKNPRPPKFQGNAVGAAIMWLANMTDGQFRNTVSFLVGICLGIAFAILVAILKLAG